MLKQCLHRCLIICKGSFTSVSNQSPIKSTDIRYFRSIVKSSWIPRISRLSSRPICLDLKETRWPSRHYSTKSGVLKESKSMKKSKVSGGAPDGMHQTKLGQFFKRSTTPGDASADSPVKKENGKDKVEVEVRELGNGKSAGKSEQNRPSKSASSEDEKVTKKSSSSGKAKPEAKSGQKRRSKSASSEDEKVPKKASSSKVKPEEKRKSGQKRRSRSSSSEDEKVTKKSSSSGKAKPEAKKQRRRVIEADSSSEDEPAISKDAEFSDDDGDHKARPVKNKKGSSSRESTPVNKNGSSEKKKQSGKTDKSPEAEVKLKSTKDASDKKPEKVNDEKKSQPSQNKSSGGSALAAPKGWKPDYNPAKNKYHPIDDASWERGERVPYLALAKTLEAIEATSSRLKNMEILANYFRSVIILSPNDLLLSVYLCLNKLAPAYEGEVSEIAGRFSRNRVELGVAETNVMKAIAQATGRSFDKIKSDAAVAGDLGIVAENSRSTQKTLFQPHPLTVDGVFHKLKDVAGLTGSASHGKKIGMITSLLVACKYSEARYLARSLLGKLRIGLAEQSLLQAIAQACFLTPPDQDLSEWPPKFLDRGKKLSTESLKSKFEEEAYKIKSAYCECPNYDILVKALQENGTDSLTEQCKLTPGIPPRPMLAQPTKGVADVLERFDGIKFTCEYKYDGERAQVHLLENGTINIYSRNQENNTSKYPDIISRFSKCIKGNVTSCILDTEAVAWDIEKKSILPFQVLSTRKRKDADESEIKVQVCLFAFDLIYLNGKSLIKEPLIKRRELLWEHFQAVTGEFVFATSLDTESMEEVQEFLEESVKGNCEGLMVKTLDEKASYELAKRSQKWLKLKKDYLDSGGDSLDLVVIGGFLGKGKRTGNYGGYLLACYDPDEEVYQTICKLGTGFSDEQLHQHAESLKPHVIPNPKSYYRFHTQLTPDHWFDAVQVWEVKCADLSLSPVHTAAEGMADSKRGISLRFPRFIRIRDDKKIDDATTSSQVADMYKSQEVVKNSTEKKRNDDEDDFY